MCRVWSSGPFDVVSQWDVLAKGRLQSYRNTRVILVVEVTMGQVYFTLLPSYPHEICWVPIEYGPVGLQNRWEHFDEVKRVLSVPRFEPLTLQLVGQSLYRLRRPGLRESL
jgi:hypothetical protein